MRDPWSWIRLSWLLGIGSWPDAALLTVGILATLIGAALFVGSFFLRDPGHAYGGPTTYVRAAMVGSGGLLAWMGWVEASDAAARLRRK